MKLWAVLLTTGALSITLSACSHTATSTQTSHLSSSKKQNLISQCRELNRRMTNIQSGMMPTDTPSQRNNTLTQLRRNYNAKGCASLN